MTSSVCAMPVLCRCCHRISNQYQHVWDIVRRRQDENERDEHTRYQDIETAMSISVTADATLHRMTIPLNFWKFGNSRTLRNKTKRSQVDCKPPYEKNEKIKDYRTSTMRSLFPCFRLRKATFVLRWLEVVGVYSHQVMTAHTVIASTNGQLPVSILIRHA